MQIFSELKRDHARLRELLSSLEVARSKDRAALLDKFRVDWTIHSRAEEHALYRTLLDDDRTHEHVLNGLDDHRSIDQMIEDLEDLAANSGRALSGDADEWLLLFKNLKAEVENHFYEEEREIFPVIRPTFATDEAEELGEVFEELRAELGQANQVAARQKKEATYGTANT